MKPSWKLPAAWLLLALSSSFFVAGCQNTADGVQKDASNAAVNTQKGVEDAGAAVSLTPKVKTALVANPFLSEAGNSIDVDSTADRVTLKGFVTTDKNKKLAEELAAKVIKDSGSAAVLDNQLTVKP